MKKSDIPAFRMYGTLDLSFDCREKFRKGLNILAGEHVDLVMGNHPQQNDTEGKLKKIQFGESIIDPTEWRRLLRTLEKRLDKVEEDERGSICQ